MSQADHQQPSNQTLLEPAMPECLPAPKADPVIIPDRGEFVDTLNRLRRGHVLVRPRAARDDQDARCMLDSGFVYTAYPALANYGLIDEYTNPEGFDTMCYYRLTEHGQRFADQACQAWRQRPLLERLAVRLLG